jgi:hypothetical protein
MKKMLLAAGIAVFAFLFAACSTTQQGQASAMAVNIKTQVSKACSVFQPVALDAQTLYALDPKVDLAINAMNGLCAANSEIDPTSIQTLAKTTIPAAVKALAGVTGVDPAIVQGVGSALTLANVALNLWVNAYVPTAPASGASAPVAASQ